MHCWAGPLHQLADFYYGRDVDKAAFIKPDPGRAIRLAEENCLGIGMPSVPRMISYPLAHDRSGAGPLQHCLKDRRLNRIVRYGEGALGRHGLVTGSHRLIVSMR